LRKRELTQSPSSAIQLNRAVGIAMRHGPEAGLAHIDAMLEHGELANYYLTHSRADMYRRSAGQLRLVLPMRRRWR
jgi:predicted RNA polymerase sigma factor